MKKLFLIFSIVIVFIQFESAVYSNESKYILPTTKMDFTKVETFNTEIIKENVNNQNNKISKPYKKNKIKDNKSLNNRLLQKEIISTINDIEKNQNELNSLAIQGLMTILKAFDTDSSNVEFKYRNQLSEINSLDFPKKLNAINSLQKELKKEIELKIKETDNLTQENKYILGKGTYIYKVATNRYINSFNPLETFFSKILDSEIKIKSISIEIEKIIELEKTAKEEIQNRKNFISLIDKQNKIYKINVKIPKTENVVVSEKSPIYEISYRFDNVNNMLSELYRSIIADFNFDEQYTQKKKSLKHFDKLTVEEQKEAEDKIIQETVKEGFQLTNKKIENINETDLVSLTEEIKNIEEEYQNLNIKSKNLGIKISKIKNLKQAMINDSLKIEEIEKITKEKLKEIESLTIQIDKMNKIYNIKE
jgi:hypothetical protein